ncbi:MAG: hypothetical protein WC319_13810, partial [Candidatus Paceibacterota bacterium]
FGPEGLTLTVKDISNCGAVTGLLRKNVFLDYTPMNVPIGNIPRLLSVLNAMSGNVELSIKENAFIINSDNNDAKIIMVDEKYINCDLETLPTLAHDGGFELDSNVFTTIKKNTATLRSEKTGVIAEVKNNIFYVRTGEKESDELTTKTKVDYKDVRTKYGITFLEFISVITGKVMVAFNEDYPILITSTEPDSTIKWMVSPLAIEET